MKKGFPIMFLPFAVMFTAMPIAFASSIFSFADEIEGEHFPLPLIIIVLSIFMCVGIGFWVAIIRSTVKIIKIKKALSEGSLGSGNFVEAISGITVNGTAYYKIKYWYNDQNGNYFEGTSPYEYGSKDVEYFQRYPIFKIKYNGKISAIVEDVRYDKLSVNQPSTVNTTLQASPIYCEYCGAIIAEGEKKCLSCGATSKNKKKRV